MPRVQVECCRAFDLALEQLRLGSDTKLLRGSVHSSRPLFVQTVVPQTACPPPPAPRPPSLMGAYLGDKHEAAVCCVSPPGRGGGKMRFAFFRIFRIFFRIFWAGPLV